VTRLLRRWRAGDEAALGELMPLVYDRLRRMAQAQMRGERPGHTLQPTALVHEAYERMVDLELSWQDRVHFLSMAARAMRRVLVDHARAHRAAKRGRGAVRVSLHEEHAVATPAVDLLELDRALDRLRRQEDRLGRVVELHYFGGLTYKEMAGALGISEATVDRHLRFARAWLLQELDGDSGGER
jgi:RNA polymerase sigma factor (TIGR02999 family)